MEKETKKLWWTVGSSFAAGMLVAFIGITCYCCPSRAESDNLPMQPAMMQKVPMHHGMHGRHHGFKRPEITAEMREHFAAKLGLTDEQKATLDVYRQEDMAKFDVLKAKKEALHKEFEALRKASRERFESVLTDAQKEILKTMKPKHLHGWHKKHGDFAPRDVDAIQEGGDAGASASADEISTEIVEDVVLDEAPVDAPIAEPGV